MKTPKPGPLDLTREIARLRGLANDILSALAVLERCHNSDMARKAPIRLSRMSEICETVCLFYGITRESMAGKARHTCISVPRMMAMSLCQHLDGASSTETGHYFDRDHSTVLHATRRIEQLRADAPKVAESWAAIIDIIKGQRRNEQLQSECVRRHVRPKEGGT